MVLILIPLVLFSCKKKESFIDDDFIVFEDNSDIEEEMIFSDTTKDEKVDWASEKIRLKGVGIAGFSEKEPVRDFCTIMVLIQKDIDDYIERNYKNESQDFKNTIIKSKSSEFYKYYNLTPEETKDFAEKYSSKIEEFIQTHPQYLEVLQKIEG